MMRVLLTPLRLLAAFAAAWVEPYRTVPVTVHCDVCQGTLRKLSHFENAVLHAHQELPCPCGGALVHVDPDDPHLGEIERVLSGSLAQAEVGR